MTTTASPASPGRIPAADASSLAYDMVRHPEILTNDPEVIRVISARHRAAATGGQAQDGYRLGIVVEGGNMRGIVSGGVLMALEAMGMTNIFDVAFGSSAGAINLAYFLTGQANFGGTIYYDDLTDGRFLSFRRFPRVANLDYLVEDVMLGSKPLDVARLRRSPTRLNIFATDVDTGTPARFTNHGAPSDRQLLTYLHASAAMPIYYHKPVAIDGRRYLDANVSNSIPIAEAWAECTHILVCLTRPYGYRAPKRRFSTLIDRLFAGNDLPVVWQAYKNRHRQYNQALDRVFSTRPADAPRVFAICPGRGDYCPSKLTRNPADLKRAAAEAMVRTMGIFEHSFAEILEQPGGLVVKGIAATAV